MVPVSSLHFHTKCNITTYCICILFQHYHMYVCMYIHRIVLTYTDNVSLYRYWDRYRADQGWARVPGSAYARTLLPAPVVHLQPADRCCRVWTSAERLQKPVSLMSTRHSTGSCGCGLSCRRGRTWWETAARVSY